MAIPTISGVTPIEGLPRGGTMVTISGANFRIQDDGDDWCDQPAQSMSVTFGSRDCDSEQIFVRSTGLIECISPYTDADDIPDLVDITVTNIDNDGVPIAGETVTESDAYSYVKPSLNETTEVYQTETEVVKEFVLYLKRNLDALVVVSMNPDFKEANSDPYPEEATSPAIYLVGPSWTRDTMGASALNDEFKYIDGVEHKEIEAWFFDFDIVGITDKFRTTNNLGSIFWDTIENAPDIEIMYHGHAVYVPIEGVSEPNSFDARQQKDGLNQFQASIRLVGVPGKTEVMRKFYATEPTDVEVTKWEE